MRNSAGLLGAVVGAAAAVVVLGGAGATGTGEPPKACCALGAEAYVLGHNAKAIDGKQVDLAQYKGKVVLIVNTASKCGMTPQYEGLQKLYEAKKEAGLVILGFPANDFRGQEPGTNEEIAAFCSSKFGVTFPMFEKVAVTGEQKHPLFAQLAGQPVPIGGEPKWNFTKFLVDREGKVVARFEPRTKPDNAEFLRRVESLLGEKPAAESGAAPSASS